MIALLVYLREDLEIDWMQSKIQNYVAENDSIIDVVLLNKGQTEVLEGVMAERYLPMATGRGIAAIPLAPVIYIEKALRSILIHMEDGSVYSYYGKFEDILPFLDRSFLRCHKSYIVNLQKAVELQRYFFLLRNGKQLPVSQKKYQSARIYFTHYLDKNTGGMYGIGVSLFP